MANAIIKTFFCLSVVLLLTACANLDKKHVLYQMIDDSACIREMGYPNCHPDSMEYQQYEQQREAIKQGE
jgi:hypothetical protein